MANVGVTFDFAAESAKLRSEVDKVRREMSSIRQSTQALEKGFKTLGGFIAGAFSVGAITSFLSRVNQAADQLNDLSGRLGASAANLQVLQVAAQQAGGSAEAMNTALAKLSTSIGDALAGSKQASEAFGRLGINARELATLKTDEAMRRVSDALSAVGNTYERASIAQDIFGKGAKDLAGFFADAPGAISETEAALQAAGAALSDLDVAKIGVMNDELALQSTIVSNLGTKFLSGLSPAVNVAVEAFANMTANLGGATDAGRAFGVVMTAAIKGVEAAVYGLAAVFETLRSVVATVLAAISNSAGNVIGLVASASEALGLSFAPGLRAASDGALAFGESFASIAASARANAAAAVTAAIEAGRGMLNAGAIFEEQARQLEARAAAAAARAGAAQGAAGAGAAGAAAGQAAADRVRGGISAEGSLRGFDRELVNFDPLKDPGVIQQSLINQSLLDLDDQYRQTLLGRIDSFNQTTLGMMLNYGQQQISWEQNKADIIGGLASGLVSTAMQAGGRLGKFGKALAIAQTIWNTGQAVMTAMAQVPWPANIAAAALAAATGVAQLANIKKTNIGSGGSIVGAKGGGASATSPSFAETVPGTQPQQEARNVSQVIIQGNVFSSQETAEWIIGQIRDAVSSRDVVFISANSRQAMELAGA